ncbi:hypothetical protein RV05_GL002341 [Enterococcus hirae]|nr:hypothetical protein RV05_GL002341 [Enterococcus hirae]
MIVKDKSGKKLERLIGMEIERILSKGYRISVIMKNSQQTLI